MLKAAVSSISILLLLGVNSWAVENLTCQLKVERFVHQGENFLPDGVEILSVGTKPVSENQVVILKETVYPIKCLVTVTSNTSLYGSLTVDYDQPSAHDENTVAVSEALILQTRDHTSAGYDNYSLHCRVQ